MVKKHIQFFAVRPILFDKDGNRRSSNEPSQVNVFNRGVYIFEDGDGKVVYVGQGGGRTKQSLRDRISQELRASEQDTGATLSKNVKKETKEEFSEFIKDWQLLVISFDELPFSLELLEAFFIALFNPIYNKKK